MSDSKPVEALSRDRCDSLFGGLTQYRALAVAVSGGADSLALLLLLHRWRESLDAGPDLTVLTVDHGLRPESADEAAMVGRVASRLGLSHDILHWTDGASVKTGVQAKARAARYDLMAAYAHAHDIDALLTAHHLDDQAETFLMRLKRGSGLDGLAAIPPVGEWAGIAILRPLLDLSKAQLMATLEEAGIAWADDRSNLDPRYERARLRRTWDSLAAAGFTPVSIARSAKRLSRARAALEAVTETFLAEAARFSGAGSAEIDRKALFAAPEEIALRALQRLISAVGGRREPLRLAKLEDLLVQLRAEPWKIRTLGGCRIAPGSDILTICRELRRQGIGEITLVPGQQALWDNRFVVSLEEGALSPVHVRALGQAGAEATQEVLETAPWLESVPVAVRAGLPSCWRNRQLLSVSCKGLEPEDGRAAAAFRARFVRAPF